MALLLCSNTCARQVSPSGRWLSRAGLLSLTSRAPFFSGVVSPEAEKWLNTGSDFHQEMSGVPPPGPRAQGKDNCTLVTVTMEALITHTGLSPLFNNI